MADIGATNTRCALLNDKGQELAPEVFENANFTGVAGILGVYLDHRRASDRPKRAALAVAAPILGDAVQMINIDWQFSQSELKQALGFQRLICCNDFAAIAWALPHLGATDLHAVGGGAAKTRATMAALGPGSGLGVSALVPAADGWAAVTGEGGHVSMPAVTAEEQEVVALLRERYGTCSAERVLSGPGLINLYVALAELAGRGQPTVTAEDVTKLARQGEPLARKTLAMFFAMLGTVASDLALTTGAHGGLYIAGGIVPRLVNAIDKSEFRARFEAKGRYRDYLAAIPTHVITAELPAFRGLRHLLGYR
jgi:glucokinase